MLSRTLRTFNMVGKWTERNISFPDRSGFFNLKEAAKVLELDPEYVRSLYRPLHYSYDVRGQNYPAEYGKSSRPGNLVSNRRKMFPLYSRSSRLTKRYMRLPQKNLTTL